MERKEAVVVLQESKRQNEIMRDNPSTFFTSKTMASGVDSAKKRIAALDMAIATLSQTNEPLTLEELREMDGEPVWVVYDQDAAKTTPGFDPLTLWALVEVTKDSVFLTNNLGGRTAYADDQDLAWAGITVYRRPPEGEEERHGD
jgi:hypothetical protein